MVTNADQGWSFNVPNNADDINIALAWTDPASTPAASVNLVNDVDLAIKHPSGTWTNLSNNLDNLRGLTLASPAQGTWEVHVVGTNIPNWTSILCAGHDRRLHADEPDIGHRRRRT